MGLVNPYLLVITLNVSGLYSPIKKMQSGKKQDIMIYCLQESCFSIKDTQTQKKGIEKSYFKQMETVKNTQEQLYLHQIDFKLKIVKRDREGLYIMIKGPIHQKDITIVFLHPTSECIDI